MSENLKPKPGDLINSDTYRSREYPDDGSHLHDIGDRSAMTSDGTYLFVISRTENAFSRFDVFTPGGSSAYAPKEEKRQKEKKEEEYASSLKQ